MTRGPGRPARSDAKPFSLKNSTTDKSSERPAPVLRTRASRTSVQNSSGMEEDESEELQIPTRSIRRVLKEVAIPVMAPSKSRGRLKVKLPVVNGFSAATSPSPSINSPSLDDSTEYETPGTSISTTPATSFRRKTRSSLNAGSGLASGGAGQRKRSRLAIQDTDDDEDEDDMMDTSADAQLARALQEEEYRGPNSKRVKSGYDSYKPVDHIDLNEDDDLSSAVSVTSSEAFVKLKKSTATLSNARGKAPVKPASRGRPLRSASSSARKTTAFKLGEDVSELSSIANSDDDFDLDDDSLAISTEEESDDDEPLIGIASGSGSALAAETDVTSVARSRKKAAGTWTERRKKRVEAQNRIMKYVHIQDRWERKRAMNRDRLEDAHPKLQTMWKTLENVPILELQKAEQPTTITRKLKSFQLEGLSWMMRQEKTDYKGGLLGDEMGMGKTIQAVSLIMSDYPAKQPTLVVVPPVALMQWSNEIREYTDGKLKVLVYHGQNSKVKSMSIKELKKYDVIMVSYNSLESLYRKETKGWSRGETIVKEASPLHAIHYHRLILDEAHSIKQRTTGVAKACFALKGSHKWCLSGTPVQNRIGEFFSLLRFLEVRPFADYFCRSCDCEQLHWKLNDDHMCEACNHGGSEHISVFNQELLNPITGDDPELREEALSKLHMITARIMLRRMKRDHTSSMELPPKEVVIHNEFFCEIERDFSSSIMTNSSRKFDTYVSQGVMLNNYANIFGLIMQMRQVANHPDLLLKKNGQGGQNVLICNICDEPAEEAIRSRCHHEFCRSCVKSYVESFEGSGSTADCPRCHIPLTIDFEQPDIEQDEEQVKKSSIINRIKMENWTSSTKIEMLVYDLYKLRSKKQTLKSIVFSQFTSMLQLIEWRLRRAGFNTVMLDGSMSPAQRQKSIEYFMNNANVEVFLVSLKAGGVALNLTEASRVFIVDPWWNPAAEWQSADRCHRIGQKRPCVITRLCIEDSVESRMVLLQEKKAAMISGTINNDKVAMDKLSPEDLQFLFRGT
ncbi:hypothetical protein K432DRAFT_426975 [Lepidopterella palustris CBS 459.81]|uniref:DNA repair protein RAD16 n=1 Tax=Lepidopterella palustris CBS 459.81 TaxID=1314670 RepID=A0A8E2E813_9PEZI|nr:hypothetical protein K432DRAFT_426975 [Lepidopterella palustris CBS 459.81]